ncbi:hypothetical protein LINPERPRIM_LOCUS28185 [Linum perenne]
MIMVVLLLLRRGARNLLVMVTERRVCCLEHHFEIEESWKEEWWEVIEACGGSVSSYMQLGRRRRRRRRRTQVEKNKEERKSTSQRMTVGKWRRISDLVYNLNRRNCRVNHVVSWRCNRHSVLNDLLDTQETVCESAGAMEKGRKSTKMVGSRLCLNVVFRIAERGILRDCRLSFWGDIHLQLLSVLPFGN